MRIAGYDDLRSVGRGGFGVVYQGRDHRFAREVAVKVLNGVLDATMAARFERECHAVGALSGHPHIVVVHDSGETEDGLAYLVMELLSGGSLADRLASAGPQPWPVAAELGVQLGGALETAHRGGVLHRDVKPENVLFSAYRQPKLVDFGIATVSGGFETKSASISASLAHAAPEILAGKRSSVASDVYALGSTLFQVLTGSPAFVNADDETMFPLLARIAAAPLPDLRPFGVPEEVVAVLERAMAKAPEDRYDSALAFALALQDAALVNGQIVSHPVVMGDDTPVPVASSPETARVVVTPSVTPPLDQQVSVQDAVTAAAFTPPVVSPSPVSPVPRRSRRVAVIAASAAAVVLIGGGTVLVLQRGEDAAPGPSMLQFAAVQDATVAASRTWSLDDAGTALSSDLTLRNPTGATVSRTVIEVIPKSVAEHVDEVTFSPADVTVIDADPVVRRLVRLGARQVVHLRWTVTLTTPADSGDLQDLADDQRAAELALVPRLASIAAAARVPLASLVPFVGAATQVTPSATAKPTPTPSGSRLPSLAPLPTGTTYVPPATRPTYVPPTTPPTTPPTVALKPPGAPRSILIGYVQVVSYKFDDPAAEPTYVSVKVAWAAPSSGGAATSYCVRWTGYTASGRFTNPSTPTCVTAQTARITVPHVNPAGSYLKWEVQARNKAGASGWQHGLGIVPDLVGTRQSSGVDKLRAAGFRVQFNQEIPDDPAYSCIITAQSPRSGTLIPASYVTITWKQCPP